jgi:Response regulator containing a CheY-like receiver domain and an HTH DNA-binding domain
LSLVKADIVLLDCSRPEGDYDVITIINSLRQRFPNIAIITMGDCDKHRALSEQIQPDVAAHFYKSLTPEDLIAGLRATWLEYNRGHDLIVEPLEAINSHARQRLSAKEKRVIEYIHAGFTVSQTAARFQRSVKTISAQKRAAMYKLGLKRDSDIFRLKINDI